MALFSSLVCSANFRRWLATGILGFGAGLLPVGAQTLAVVEKQHRVVESGLTAVADDTSLGGAWRMSASVDPSATPPVSLTLPGGQTQPMTLANGVYGGATYFASQSDMEAKFPNGTYRLAFNGSSVAATLTADGYPSLPVVTASAGTWSQGSLNVDPSQPVSLSFSFGANFVSGHGRMGIVVTGPGNFSSQADNGSAFASSTATLNLPAGSLTAGSTYQVKMDSDNIQTIDTTTIPGFTVVSVYEAETSFTLRASASAATPPRFTLQPASLTATPANTVVFNASATGSPPPSYQWYFNQAPLPGAVLPRLVLKGVSAANGGTYRCVATNAGGVANSNSVTLTIDPQRVPGHLINLSVLSRVTDLLTIGFVVGGDQTSGQENLLIRGIGPGLAAFSVPGVLPDPSITLYSSPASAVLAANTNWTIPAAGIPLVQAADSATGAFALDTANADSALVRSLTGGSYTVQVRGAVGDAGSALTEAYDDTPVYTAATPRLINVSCLTAVAARGVLTAGFVIGGGSSRTMLIRASGPALANFSIPTFMVDPTLALFNQSDTSTPLLTNAGWGGDPQIAAAAGAVYAFNWSSPLSADSGVLVTLPPGNYTAQVTSASGAAGSALIEVYEVP